MLQSVRLINYRGLKDTTIPLAPITLLTGTNGVGKTSVLEGLYFMLAQPVPDAAIFPRYQPFIHIQQANILNVFPNMQLPVIPVRGYDYPSFWKECPTYGASESHIEATSGTLKLLWEMKISDFAGLAPELKDGASAYGLPSGAGKEYVLWQWRCFGKAKKDHKSHRIIDVNQNSKAAQLLSMEPLVTPKVGEITATACRYIDMPSTKHIALKLSLQTEKLLTSALKIINRNVTGVRHGGSSGRLRVIINDESDYSLGTLGVGAETWANMLLSLSELASTSIEDDFSNMLLVDEIGAGIHYSKLEEMWDFLSMFLSQYPYIQMVFTTHSQDCIKAFCKVFQKSEPDKAHIVRMHKFDENDGVQTTVYPHETFTSILSGDWEVRG